MKTIINHNIGEIIYEESFWTGKKEITINGQKLTKIDKMLFSYVDEEQKTKYVNLTGNYISGTKISVDNNNIQITPKPKWYECVLAILIFVVTLIWANSAALCSIVPIVGGAIGGAISGAMSIIALLLMKNTNNILFKVLIALGMFVATIIIGFILALVLISVVA